MTTHAQPNTTTEAAEFAAFLVGHLGGRTHETVSAEFHKLVAAVTEHGKKGSLVLAITIEPSKGHVDGDPLAISVDSTLKAPKATPPASLYFVDANGNATREDPRQIALDFRTVTINETFKDA
ncbi:hypothetical protein [Kitasatospora sp. NPDC004289]